MLLWDFFEVMHFLKPEEKKKKKEKYDIDHDIEEFHPPIKVEVEQQGDRPVRACRTQQGEETKGLKLFDGQFNFFFLTESESTPRQQLLEHFLRQLQR